MDKRKLVCQLFLYRQQPVPDMGKQGLWWEQSPYVGKQGGLWWEAVTIWVSIGSHQCQLGIFWHGLVISFEIIWNSVVQRVCSLAPSGVKWHQITVARATVFPNVSSMWMICAKGRSSGATWFQLVTTWCWILGASGTKKILNILKSCPCQTHIWCQYWPQSGWLMPVCAKTWQIGDTWPQSNFHWHGLARTGTSPVDS